MTTTIPESANRRRFLYVATATAGVLATGTALWPLIDQMNPDASVRAMASLEVDISGVSEGTQITVKWRGKPVFIRHRSAEDIEKARAVPIETLPDPHARNANLSAGAEETAADKNRALDPDGKWLVMMGVCTHLGCVPIGNSGDFGGWFCPCHGSHYDSSGRVRKGPAPENLPVPPAVFLSSTVIRLG